MGSTNGVGAGDDEARMSSGVARSVEEEDGALRGNGEGRTDMGGGSDDIEADVAGVGNEVERMESDVERLINEVAGRARVEEEREKDISTLRREVEGLKCCFSDVRKCVEELRGEMRAVVEQREVVVLGRLDEWKHEVDDLKHQMGNLRHQVEEGRREVEEGRVEEERVEEAGRMRELKVEVDREKAEVAWRLSELQQRQDERRTEASTCAASAMDDKERVIGLNARLESFLRCWAVTVINLLYSSKWYISSPREQKLPMAKHICVASLHALDITASNGWNCGVWL
ncbi:unnamed protein product [Closterium sp. NIES-65]|nr:unnamed protein product [Closterium sp. NIES-65]